MMTFKVLSKPTNRWLIGLVVGATAITGGIVSYGICQYGMVSQKPALVETDHPVKKVTALGRLEPEAEVIKLSAPLALDGDRIIYMEDGHLADESGGAVAEYDHKRQG